MPKKCQPHYKCFIPSNSVPSTDFIVITQSGSYDLWAIAGMLGVVYKVADIACIGGGGPGAFVSSIAFDELARAKLENGAAIPAGGGGGGAGDIGFSEDNLLVQGQLLVVDIGEGGVGTDIPDEDLSPGGTTTATYGALAVIAVGGDPGTQAENDTSEGKGGDGAKGGGGGGGFGDSEGSGGLGGAAANGGGSGADGTAGANALGGNGGQGPAVPTSFIGRMASGVGGRVQGLGGGGGGGWRAYGVLATAPVYTSDQGQGYGGGGYGGSLTATALSSQELGAGFRRRRSGNGNNGAVFVRFK